MKRFVITAAAACTLALAGVAAAGTREYRGTIEPDSPLKFDALVKHRKVKQVQHFSWKNVKVHCVGGPIFATGSFDDPMGVTDNRFHGTLVGPNGAKVRVTGRFRHHGRDATGIFRIHGDIDEVHTDCHTGGRDWTARRG